MALNPSYQDYLQSAPGSIWGGSEGQGFNGITEQQWNQMSDADKWKAVGNIGIATTDPRYADLVKQTGIDPSQFDPGKSQSISIGPGAFGNGMIVDPSKVFNIDGMTGTYWGNATPRAQQSHLPGWWAEYGPGIMTLVGIAAGGYGAEAAGMGGAAGGSSALETGGILTGADIAGGTSGAGYIAGSGAAGSAAAGSGSLVGNSGNPSYAGSFDEGGMPGYGEAPGSTFDPYGTAPGGSAPSGGGFDANGVWHDVSTLDPVKAGTLPSLSSGEASNGLLGQAMNWAQNNPMRALGLLQTAYGMVGGGKGSASNSGGSGGSGSKGGSGTPAKMGIPQQQFYVNPYLQAQMQRGYQ